VTKVFRRNNPSNVENTLIVIKGHKLDFFCYIFVHKGIIQWTNDG